MILRIIQCKSQYFFEDVFVLLNIHSLILERPAQIRLKKKEEEKERKSLFIRMSGFQHVGSNYRLFLD